MTSTSNSPGSYFSSKTRSSKIEGNYLKELSEDLKLRKQELLELFKPLEDRNSLLFQKLMSNLEEKQRSLQIMRQIMAGKGNDDSSVTELIKEAEEMKQNLERKNKMLRNEMEMLWNKTFNTEELSEQQKLLQLKNKADMQDGKAPKTPSSSRKTKNELEMLCAEKVKEIRKEKQQRKMEWVKYQEQANIFQNEFSGKVIELRIEALKNYQKANDLKLSLYIQQNFEPKQAPLNLPGSQENLEDWRDYLSFSQCSIHTFNCCFDKNWTSEILRFSSPIRTWNTTRSSRKLLSFKRIGFHKPALKKGKNVILDTPPSKSGYYGHYSYAQSNY